jgi:alkylated DNA repair dioxygenase AlkB
MPTELLFSEPARRDLGEGCWLEHHPRFAAADAPALEPLLRELPWVQEVYTRGGRNVPAPRLSSFHGDDGCAYVYSGITYRPAPWTEPLAALRARLRAAFGVDWNSVLVNLYRDGRDSVGWHADDEPELGPTRDDIAIASLSFGAARRFVLKHRRDGRRLAYELGGGDLLLMRGRTQQLWLHALPKTQAPIGARINLTFRVITARVEPPNVEAVDQVLGAATVRNPCAS